MRTNNSPGFIGLNFTADRKNVFRTEKLVAWVLLLTNNLFRKRSTFEIYNMFRVLLLTARLSHFSSESFYEKTNAHFSIFVTSEVRSVREVPTVRWLRGFYFDYTMLNEVHFLSYRTFFNNYIIRLNNGCSITKIYAVLSCFKIIESTPLNFE